MSAVKVNKCGLHRINFNREECDKLRLLLDELGALVKLRRYALVDGEVLDLLEINSSNDVPFYSVSDFVLDYLFVDFIYHFL